MFFIISLLCLGSTWNFFFRYWDLSRNDVSGLYKKLSSLSIISLLFTSGYFGQCSSVKANYIFYYPIELNPKVCSSYVLLLMFIGSPSFLAKRYLSIASWFASLIGDLALFFGVLFFYIPPFILYIIFINCRCSRL